MKGKLKQSKFYSFIMLGIMLVAIPSLQAADESQIAANMIESSHFRVSYKSQQEPLPLNAIHNWILHVENLDGEPVERANIYLDGGMPAHNHGLPTNPKVSEIGNGDYLVEGVKFSMTGLWEMWFDIHTESVTDRIKFVITF